MKEEADEGGEERREEVQGRKRLNEEGGRRR
jgi:hypothetical protein